MKIVLEFSKKTEENLKTLKQLTESDYGEIISKSLALYHMIKEFQNENGFVILLKDNDIKKLQII